MERKRRLRAVDVALAGIAVVAVCVAVYFGVCYAQARVPQGAAARVNDQYVLEDDVADYIYQCRVAYGCASDADWASYLLSNNLNPTTFRQNSINQLALDALVNAQAEELGVAPSDEEVAEQIEGTKSALSFNDDTIWAETLEQQGITEERFEAQIRTSLAKQALLSAQVPVPEASEEETLAYVRQNKAGQEMRHSYRIIFTGEDAYARATECKERLDEAGSSLDADVFSGFALSYSDDESVEGSGGAYGWSDATDMSSEYLEVLSTLQEGQVSEINYIEADDAQEIIYCDVCYSFPSSGKIDSLELSDLPASLVTYVTDAAGEGLWSTDCNAYLSNLLAGAKITYYPTPDDAPYNVDLSLASSAGEDGQGEQG